MQHNYKGDFVASNHPIWRDWKVERIKFPDGSTRDYQRGNRPTDSEVQEAERIVVSKRSRSTGIMSYRTVGFFDSLDDLANYIVDHLRIYSP